jgi:hypothetical protein
MKLTKVERERITDGLLKIQGAKASLEGVDETKVHDFQQIEDCLEAADDNLRQALKESRRPGGSV